MKKKEIKAWAVLTEDGAGIWAVEQMLVYQTKVAALKRIVDGGKLKAWKVVPIIITY